MPMSLRRAIGFAWKRNPHRCLGTYAASPPPPTAASPNRRGFLKYAVVTALTRATAFSCCASYAYSLDEIDEKTKSFRELAKYTDAGDGGTALGKFHTQLQ